MFHNPLTIIASRLLVNVTLLYTVQVQFFNIILFLYLLKVCKLFLNYLLYLVIVIFLHCISEAALQNSYG